MNLLSLGHISILSPIYAFLLLISTSSAQTETKVVTADNVDAILITSKELKPAWKPFIDWKQKNNLTVKLITTEEIAKQYQGPDIQEKIRLCVRQHIDKHATKSIILGGDSAPHGGGVVPDRDTIHVTRWGREADIPTDIYFISPTNWDADGDQIYGEFIDDKDAISYPDGSVGLGRIPVRTAADIQAYTDKVISYESNYPAGEFGKNMAYTCAVKSANPKVVRSWDDHLSKILTEGKVQQFFTDSTPWDKETPGDHALSPGNFISLINSETTGKFHIHGHGLLHGWLLEEKQMFTNAHVSKLTNKDAYPIITTVSCFTGHYDAAKDPSISEAMLRVPDAGAIAIIAPCRQGKPHFLNPRVDFPLMIHFGKMDGTTETMTLFWEKGVSNNLTTGHALMQTKASMIQRGTVSPDFHMCIVELNLLGDPTLKVQP